MKKRSERLKQTLELNNQTSIRDEIWNSIIESDTGKLIAEDEDHLWNTDYVELGGTLDCDIEHEKAFEKAYLKYDFQYCDVVMSGIPVTPELKEALSKVKQRIESINKELVDIKYIIDTEINDLMMKGANDFMNNQKQ